MRGWHFRASGPSATAARLEICAVNLMAYFIANIAVDDVRISGRISYWANYTPAECTAGARWRESGSDFYERF